MFFDVVADVIFFPIWWYTSGLKLMVLNRGTSVVDMEEHLALRLLLLNMFKPMFAQYDRAGRVISFFMRLIILIFRSVYFVIYLALQLLFILMWIALPVFVFYRLMVIYAPWYIS